MPIRIPWSEKPGDLDAITTWIANAAGVTPQSLASKVRASYGTAKSLIAATSGAVIGKDDPLYTMIRRQPTHLPGMLKRREVVERYCAAMHLSPHNWAFYEVYGLFRLAVIAQQIYYRYHHRQTRNPAFRHFWLMVHYLDWRCLRMIRGRG